MSKIVAGSFAKNQNSENIQQENRESQIHVILSRQRGTQN